jgi:hypothetical protein
MAHERIEKWRGWIDGQIKDEVITMHLHRDTWSQTQTIIAANPASQSPFGGSSWPTRTP